MAYVHLFLGVVFLVSQVTGGYNQDRILLKDVQVLTLHSGQMTNAQRSGPVPQLKCVGGTAGCHTFVPQTVQCYNRGFDGYDIQWECKTDMDNAYRFGKVEVTCEGYGYPDDPFILRGSCGLEYTLDLTKEGHEKKNAGQHQYYGQSHDYHDRSSSYYSSHKKKSGTGFGDLVMLGIVAAIIYGVYKFCLTENHRSQGSESERPPPYSPRDPYSGSRPSAPPPPGFKPEFTDHSSHQGSSYSSGYSSGPSMAGAGAGPSMTGTGTGGGGFWSGAATGGLLGYLFGSRNNYGSGYGYNSYGPGYTQPRPHSSWGSGWGSGFGSVWGGGSSYSSSHSSPFRSSFSSGSSSDSSTGSTGTRTASGFGGTKRR